MNMPRTWLFDLDNTLHDAGPHIFPHIDRSMTRYLQTHLGLTHGAADALRLAYWQRYGATLRGLVRHHGVDPHHFLRETHSFPDLPRMLVFERALCSLIRALPGRKVLFSNAPHAYATAVLEATGLRFCFDEVFAIERLGLAPKPQRSAFLRVQRALGVAPARCILVEDTLVNLAAAKSLGMKTVWVHRGDRQPPSVDVKLRNILQLRRAAHLAR